MSTLAARQTGLGGASFAIWHKHMRKFLGNGEELFGLMIQPILWILLFGVGMRALVSGASAGTGVDYIGFMLPGIAALSAMGGAIGGGMAWLDERGRGIVREYLVAPIPRASILFGYVGSTLTKALFQALIIFAFGIFMGASATINPLGWLLGIALLVGYAAGFSGHRPGHCLDDRQSDGLSRDDHAAEPAGSVPFQCPLSAGGDAGLDADRCVDQSDKLSR